MINLSNRYTKYRKWNSNMQRKVYKKGTEVVFSKYIMHTVLNKV